MSYYSGRLIINNESNMPIDNTAQGLIATFKFSVSFNKEKLFLNNTILNQILESGAVQTYIKKECASYFNSNKDSIEKAISKIYTMELTPRIEIKIIGKYFFINFYCGRNHSIDDCSTALNRKLKNEKSNIEILRGE